jgi:hypothetical protein
LQLIPPLQSSSCGLFGEGVPKTEQRPDLKHRKNMPITPPIPIEKKKNNPIIIREFHSFFPLLNRV